MFSQVLECIALPIELGLYRSFALTINHHVFTSSKNAGVTRSDSFRYSLIAVVVLESKIASAKELIVYYYQDGVLNSSEQELCEGDNSKKDQNRELYGG